MKKSLFFVIMLSLIGLYSCRPGKDKADKKAPSIAKKTDAQVKSDVDNLLAEVNRTWNEMIQADDQMLNNLQELHAKIGRSKNYEKAAFQNVVAKRDNLKARRYNQRGLRDVAAVDAYDSAEVSVLDATNALVENSGIALQDSNAAKLHEKIQDSDKRVPIYRGYYDQAVKKYNQYLQNYQPQLKKLGTPYDTLQALPKFVE